MNLIDYLKKTHFRIVKLFISVLAICLLGVGAWYLGTILSEKKDKPYTDELWDTARYQQGELSLSFEYPSGWKYLGYIPTELQNMIDIRGTISIDNTFIYGYITLRFFHNSEGSFDDWISAHEQLFNVRTDLRSKIISYKYNAYEYDYKDGQQIMIFIENGNYVYEFRLYTVAGESFSLSGRPIREAQPYLKDIADHLIKTFSVNNAKEIENVSTLFNTNILTTGWREYMDDTEGFLIRYPSGWQTIDSKKGFIGIVPTDLNITSSDQPVIQVSVYANEHLEPRSFYRQAKGIINPFTYDQTLDILSNGKYDFFYFETVSASTTKSILIYQLDGKLIEAQLRKDQIGKIDDLQDIFYAIATSVEVYKNNWDAYNNDTYGYRLRDITNKTVLVNDVFDGGTAENPGFKILGGGHFAIGVYDNPNGLSIQDFFEKHKDPDTRYSYEKTDNNDLSAIRAYDVSRRDCAIEWVALARGTKIFTGRVEVCEGNRQSAVFEFRKVMETLQFTQNEYDIVTLKVGDKVAGMEVKEINWSMAQEKIRDGYNVQFDGQAIVSGEYQYYDQDSAFLDGEVCLYADSYTMLNLPHSTEESRIPWFCFTNKDFARQQFGPIGSTGTTTVVIDDYYDIFVGTEAWNKATLVRVIQKE